MTIERNARRQESAASSAAPMEPGSTFLRNSYLTRRRQPADITEIVGLILNKGVVIDSRTRGAAIGLETWSVDSQVAITTLDAYRPVELGNRAASGHIYPS